MASTVKNGVWKIINVKSLMALDVKGNSDKSKANVIQWNVIGWNVINAADGQIWAVTNHENGYQIKCSLTDKCLDVYSANFVSGTNVMQYDDNNGRAQRWEFVDAGKEIEYPSGSGKKYEVYYIRPYTAQNLSLDVSNGSTVAGANVQIWTNNNSTAQQWIFYPMPVLRTRGTYRILSAHDTSMSIGIAAASTANGANAAMMSDRDANNQTFVANVDDETFVTTFYIAHSEKVLDVYVWQAVIDRLDQDKYKNIQQNRFYNTSDQKFLIERKSSVTINGESYPTYEIVAQVSPGIASLAFTSMPNGNVQLQAVSTSRNLRQEWVFVKTERISSRLNQPAIIDQRSFVRDGPGSIKVSGLTFTSKWTHFQARYMIRRYEKDGSYSDSSWMNLDDDSTSRSGWGDAWTPTFTADPENGKIAVPFEKSVSLDTTWRSANIYVEVREYDPYDNIQAQAHGPERRTTISLKQNRVVSVKSANLVRNSNSVALDVVLIDSLNDGASFFRSRVLGEDKKPISEWKTATQLRSIHILGDTLLRLPNSDENLTLEWSMLSTDGLSTSGTTTFSVSYTKAFDAISTLLDDESCRLLVESSDTSYTYMYCFMEVPTNDGTKYVQLSRYYESWRAPVPLNRDTRIIIMGSNDGTTWFYGETVDRIDSHLFIWNWNDLPSQVIYKDCAAVLVNPDSPPHQTRSFSTGIKFSVPAARVYPVAFSSRNISADASISGVSIDDNVPYQAAGPVPDITSLSNVRRLISLSGNGIHPIYRTPYGDWSIVGIESVDISKSDMYYSTVNVTQRIVGD